MILGFLTQQTSRFWAQNWLTAMILGCFSPGSCLLAIYPSTEDNKTQAQIILGFHFWFFITMASLLIFRQHLFAYHFFYFAWILKGYWCLDIISVGYYNTRFIHILTYQIPRLSRTFQCQIQGPFQWLHKLLTCEDTAIFQKKCNDWIPVRLWLEIWSICPNSRTFKDLYINSRTFKAWNPNFQIFPGFQGPVWTL